MTSKAPPKILNLTTPIVRNQRTLVWLHKQNCDVHWSKWDNIVSSISAYDYWSKYDTKIVGMIVIDVPSKPEDIDRFLERLYEISKVIPMVLLSQKVLSLKSEEYWTENFDNLVNVSSMIDSYPFLESPWSGSVEDAIACFAMLCRYNRIVDCSFSKNRSRIIGNNMTYAQHIQPNETWLFTQFFQHKKKNRSKEIKDCLMKNCASPFVDKIILLNEKDESSEWKHFPGSEKIQQAIMGQRLSYSHFLQYVHDYVPENVYTILCNADIYIEDSIRELYKVDMKNKMIALLRWDVDASGHATLFGPRADSQDTWIFLSDSIKSRKWDYSTFNFCLGHPGCDNVFAGQILRNYFVISNPSLTFRTFHLHNTNIRNYNEKDIIPSDVYVNIVPSNIIDTKQQKESEHVLTTIQHDMVPFDIKSSSMSNEITYCTMLEKAGRYNWEPSTQNFYFEAGIPVYSWKKAGVTSNGLVYDLYTIYKGRQSENPLYNFWMSSCAEIFTPLQSRRKMIAVPFKDCSVFKHPDTYLLNYISKVKRILTVYPDASFWLPKEFENSLRPFHWEFASLSPVEFDEYTATWADEVVGLLPGPESLELGKEDIEALRQMLPTWKADPSPRVCAFIIDNTITEAFIKQNIIPTLCDHSADWVIRYIPESDVGSHSALQSVSLCVFIGSEQSAYKWSRLWALPKECCVVEFQQELQVYGEFQHMAHVAELKSWVLLLSKGSVEDVQDQVATQFKKWMKKNEGELFV